MSLRILVLAGVLVVTGPCLAQPAGNAARHPRVQIAQQPKPPVVVSVTMFEFTGDVPAWLTPGNAQAPTHHRLQDLWGSPVDMLTRLRKETPTGQVTLKFFGAISTVNGQEALLETGRDVREGEERRTVGTSLEVTPQVGPDGRLGLKLSLRYEEIQGFVQPEEGPPCHWSPREKRRQLSSCAPARWPFWPV